jgi:hypothetical protein
MQVGCVSLMKGDQPVCPFRRRNLAVYAQVRISGEIKRYLRDKAGRSTSRAQCYSSSWLLSIGSAMPIRDDIRDRRLALAEPPGLPLRRRGSGRLRYVCGGAGRRILVSGGERSGGRSPEAGRDSRNVPGCGGSVSGAGRVGDLAAGGIAAWPGLPRHRVPSGRLPRLALATHGRVGAPVSSAGAVQEAVAPCVGACPAGAAGGRTRRVRAHPAG